ncbi:CDP-glycerol glycerophosphotransferase family protein [Dellaglioa algida]|uniref:CDP-glycerol glycerophosphotransferase family protein n=2 Tax=Dellaglioa algida TaxID=105612 RepID=UPI0024C49502|nr:CDP-glycerol glycerophosphotransferase family protein [Dellaglioa algida]MDK1727607.1 CDP-glycerol glycerophosphotransferase family protein [Dellaglioa algida]MDK1735267.1 CDP-glycerol glycerophosphotransferase family protein [Dellaglioa algida]
MQIKKNLFLFLIKIMSLISFSKKSDNVSYLMSFGGNIDFIQRLNERCLARKQHLIVFYRPSMELEAIEIQKIGIETKMFVENISFVLNLIPLISKSSLLFVDNYFAFLATMYTKKSTKIVQLWHANGAIKSFGWDEPKTNNRSDSDKKRFQAVYDQFDNFIVGSTKMGAVFEQSYHIDTDRILEIGYPASDKFQNIDWQNKMKNNIFASYPNLKNKKVILYAPTYRENISGDVALELPEDFSNIQKLLDDETKLIIKLHPHLRDKEIELKSILSKDIVWVDDYSTGELLTITNCLITDYSSVVFDFSLLPNAEQILFYCFDYQIYKDSIGIQSEFQEWAPGPIVQTMNELVNAYQKVQNSDRQLDTFNLLWNTANDGYATKRVLDYYFK